MQTLLGELDEAVLEKKTFETDRTEFTVCYATEWFYEGQFVRRDVHAEVLKYPPIDGAAHI